MPLRGDEKAMGIIRLLLGRFFMQAARVHHAPRWRARTVVCAHPQAVYIARDRCQLNRMVLGVERGCCYDDKHKHKVVRLWNLAHDVMADA